MAANPQLDPQGLLPVPFVGEMMVLHRAGIEFHVDNVPSVPGGKWTARGSLFLSTVRMVFVSNGAGAAMAAAAAVNALAVPPLFAFDIPLLYVQGEKFNQPIFGCNNISGNVYPVSSLSNTPVTPHKFTIYFMEGGVGTFLPIFFNLLHSLRIANPNALPSQPQPPPAPAATTVSPSAHEATTGGGGANAGDESRSGSGGREGEGGAEGYDPLPAAPVQRMEEVLRNAYVDPNDPTLLYVQQPPSFSAQGLRRRNYRSHAQ